MGKYVQKILFVCLLVAISTFTYAQQQDCSKLPNKFSSYQEAYSLIKSAKFKIAENYSSFNSSWIASLSYYSCDGSKGFLMLVTKKGQFYIHKEVPIGLWKGLRNAGSKGGYYSMQIRNKYQL